MIVSDYDLNSQGNRLTMLRRDVQRHRERRALSSNTGDVHDTFRIAGACFTCLRRRRWVQPAAYGELGSANGMGEIDVKTCVMAYAVSAMRVIFRFSSSRRVPEVAPVRFEDAGSGAYLVLLAIVTGTVIKVAFHIRYQRPRTPSQRRRTCW
jgi:hypothetical protein